jgi:hypothetical protein
MRAPFSVDPTANGVDANPQRRGARVGVVRHGVSSAISGRLFHRGEHEEFKPEHCIIISLVRGLLGLLSPVNARTQRARHDLSMASLTDLPKKLHVHGTSPRSLNLTTKHPTHSRGKPLRDAGDQCILSV